VQNLRLLAAAYLEHGLFIHAFHLYQQLRVAQPMDASAEIGLARIWDEWRDYGLALDHAHRAVSLEPQSALVLDVKGRIHLHRGEIDVALASFLAAIPLAPEDAPLLANAGYDYLLQGEFEKARPYLERAVEIDASIAQARNNLGIVLTHFGEHEGALENFMAANSLAAAHNNLGVALLAERQWKAAQQQFKEALAINPSYALAARNLKEAESHLPPPPIRTIQSFPQPVPPVEVLYPRPKVSVYTIQVFSSKDPQKAVAMAERLTADTGITASIERADLEQQGIWYRARIHGFETFRAALRIVEKLADAGTIRDYWITTVGQ
jgi:tetratricopeptide (TPR) repeat protein